MSDFATYCHNYNIIQLTTCSFKARSLIPQKWQCILWIVIIRHVHAATAWHLRIYWRASLNIIWEVQVLTAPNAMQHKP